jgi:RNA polymerase sigma factor (sigma-70 family)
MREKNHAAITSYFAQQYQALVGFVRSMIADAAARDAEDIVQDVILSLLSRADAEEPIQALSAYVFRALRNRVIDELRRPVKEGLSLEADAAPGSDIRLADVLSEVRWDPADAVERMETRERIYRAVDALPPEQRAVIVATELQGYSFRELSAAWAVPIGTLLARKSRGLKALRATLAPLRDPEED